MEQEIKEIAKRIRELREVCGYTREELAKELNVDLQTYISYEEVGVNIPISVVYEIANKFRVDFNEIISGVSARLSTYHVVRCGHGQVVDRYPGYHFQDLAFRYSHKIMQPLLVELDPSDEPAELVRHAGQEFNMVLEGSLILTFEDQDIILNQGDTVYFNPTYPHGQKCNGDKPAKFVTVIAE